MKKKKVVAAGAAVALVTGAGIAWAADWDHKAGGTDWPEEFPGCSIEQVIHQSPIDVQEVTAQASDTVLDFDYGNVSLEVFNNSHTVQADVPAGNSITVTKGGVDKTYNLLQFHWHTPSENEFSGYDQDAEIHFVHQDPSDGSLAVVGVLYDTGAANAALQPFFNAGLPEYEEPNVTVADIRLGDIVPSDVGAYNFAGSLTTPPCDAGAPVDWYVMDTIDSLSQAQMGELRDLFSGEEFPSGNARGVQRVVVDDLTTVATTK